MITENAKTNKFEHKCFLTAKKKKNNPAFSIIVLVSPAINSNCANSNKHTVTTNTLKTYLLSHLP